WKVQCGGRVEEPTHGWRIPELKCQLGCRQQPPGSVGTVRCQRGGKLQSAERRRGRPTILCTAGGDLEVGGSALVFAEHRLGAVPGPAVGGGDDLRKCQGGGPWLPRGRRFVQARTARRGAVGL